MEEIIEIEFTEELMLKGSVCDFIDLLDKIYNKEEEEEE